MQILLQEYTCSIDGYGSGHVHHSCHEQSTNTSPCIVTLAVKGHKGMANPVTQGLQLMTKRTTVEAHTEELSCRNGKFYMFVTNDITTLHNQALLPNQFQILF